MQTNFTLKQLQDPDVAHSETILRKCVHCGFCTATCPTYVLLGDELDSPRGRIYLIKQMLEEDRPATEEVVKHIDRCLSCLACVTTCPSGVDYMHLVDHARKHIYETYKRPLPDRLLRQLLAFVLPHPGRFRTALTGATLAKPLGRLMPGRLGAMMKLAPKGGPKRPSALDRPQTVPAEGARKGRATVLLGCAQKVLSPEINEATVRLLTRHGFEVAIGRGEGCCGALVHHMGQEPAAHRFAKANIDAWWRLRETGGLDAIVINTSGCGTTVKDYGHMLREDGAYAEKAAEISALTVDVTEFMAEHGLKPSVADTDFVVAYHSACSLQHGQKVTKTPKHLLTKAGFTVKDVPEGHLCCGSAGTYNLLQPEIAGQLQARKVENIERTAPDLVAAGNIGCITQIGDGTAIPVTHTAQLLDYATGGPEPLGLEAARKRRAARGGEVGPRPAKDRLGIPVEVETRG